MQQRRANVAITTAVLLLVVDFIGPPLPCRVAHAATMSRIKNRNDDTWDELKAVTELPEDADRLIDALHSNANKALKAIIQDYTKTRKKSSNIRKVGSWGIALGKLYDLPGIAEDEKRRNSILVQLTDIAEGLKKSWTDEESFVEEQRVRGWPIILRNEKQWTHEGFNAGFLAMALGHAAKVQADNGEHRAAAANAEYVLGWLYDNFFSYDSGKNKLDKGKLTWIPARAPDARRRRYLSLSEVDASGTQKFCEQTPDAYNHSINLARAVMVVLQAMNRIDWAQAEWNMPEWTLYEAKLRLAEMVHQNARWFRDAMVTFKTGDNKEFDRYEGEEGTEWFIWKYREFDVFGKYIPNCDEELFEHGSRRGKLAEKLRPQDVSHAKHEMDFILHYLEWMAEEPDSGCGDGSTEKGLWSTADLRKYVITFLNRIVRDPNEKKLSQRYTCDVSGTHDNKAGPDVPELGGVEPTIEKSCRDRGRLDEERPVAAIGWLSIAVAAAKFGDVHLGKDGKHLCDILRMLDLVFSVIDPDSHNFDTGKDLGNGFGVNWGPEAMSVKYYYYNYEAAFKEFC